MSVIHQTWRKSISILFSRPAGPPSFNVSLSHRAMTSTISPSRSALNPFSMRTEFVKLQKGGVDVMLSVIHAREKGILRTKGGRYVSDRK